MGWSLAVHILAIMKKQGPCPCLHPVASPHCLAVTTRIVPTLHERELYCFGEFASCPTFGRVAQLGRRISEDEYLHIWLAPSRPE